MINGIRIIITFVLLSYASYSDFKRRRVSDIVWIVGTALACLLLASDLIFTGLSDVSQNYLIIVSFSTISLSLSGYLIYRFGYFGGADAKCMMFLGLILPIYSPSILIGSESLMSISAISNGVILSLLYPLYLGFKNRGSLYTEKYRILLYDIIPVSSIPDRYGEIVLGSRTVVIEDIHNILKWKDIDISETNKITEDDIREFHSNNVTFTQDVEDIIDCTRQISERKEVKIRPGLPLVTIIYIGFLSNLIIGDFIFGILTLF